MACHLKVILAVLSVLLVGASGSALSRSLMKKIAGINKKEGPFLGIVVPNAYEMDPLLQSSSFVPSPRLPYLDILGRRFRFGEVANHSVIVVMTGLAMLNAGISTQLLVSFFNIKGVVHYGIAGNANPNLQIGDVTIPQYWAHSGLWNWQRYGDGAEDELPLESSGDYTRDMGFLNITAYGNGTTNLLNNIWYQPEEIFPVDGVPEVRQHAFWVPVDPNYYSLSQNLKDLNLTRCVDATTCLPRQPTVARVDRGMSANIYLDNSAYRAFLYSKFNVTPIEMETAAIALVCHQQKKPFIALRALSDLAGGGSAVSNEASTFISLASQNSVDAVIYFISLLPS